MKSFIYKLGLFAVAASATCVAQTASNACSGMSLGMNGALNGFVPSPNDAWHQDITNAPVDPNSAKIINTAGDLGGSFLHPDFGTTSDDYGIPYNVVDSSQTASVPVGINLYVPDSDITVAPIPANAAVEGTPSSCPTDGNDRHLIVVDRNKCVAYEYWQAGQCNGKWSASNTALWDLSGTEKRPYGLTSADAAGLSIFEGLIRYDEIVAGQINHAIRFTAKFTKANSNGGVFAAPATHAAGNLWGTDNVIGMRLRLKANFDISKFSKTDQIILTAMKKYGMILADNGGNMFFQGTMDDRWDDNDLDALKAIPASDFDVVSMGTTYDANTAPTGTAPTISSFTASSTSVTAGSPVTLTVNAQNASYNYIDNAGFVRGNTITVNPTQTTTYTLTSRNAYGTSTASVTVNVVSKPVATSLKLTATSGAVSAAAMTAKMVSTATQYTLNATSNSPGPVRLIVLRGSATISGNVLTATRSGLVMVEAYQAASGAYSSASAITSIYVR